MPMSTQYAIKRPYVAFDDVSPETSEPVDRTVAGSQSASVDTYTSSAQTVVTRAQQADAALSSVVSMLTQAISLGTEGANSGLSSANRSALATQVNGLLTDVVAQANTSVGGQALFAGTSGVQQAFTQGTNGAYVYGGDSGVNETAIGDGLTVATNVPGDQIFTSASGNVLGSLQQLAAALQGGATSDISTAVTQVSSALSHVSEQRVVYANTVTQTQAQGSYLSQETVSLTSQQSSLVGIDLATAATNLTQAQTVHSAVLAAAAKVLPTSLLDYLK